VGRKSAGNISLVYSAPCPIGDRGGVDTALHVIECAPDLWNNTHGKNASDTDGWAFHHAEKRLLQARGILQNAFVREARMELGDDDVRHIDFLNTRVLASLDQLGIARNPLLGTTTQLK
jgi:hypothetical protein